jgi:hypothetical protein
MADSPVWTLEDRRKLTQVAFETTEAPSFGLISQGTVCSFASGLNNILHTLSSTSISGNFMPVYESFPKKMQMLDLSTTKDPFKLDDHLCSYDVSMKGEYSRVFRMAQREQQEEKQH